MPENNQANSDNDKADKDDNEASDGKLRWIIVGGGVVLVGLIFVSVYLPNLTERVKFFTANALSLVVLIAIIIQAYIYRRQWHVMERQGDTMQQQTKQTRKAIVVSRRQANLMQLQARAMVNQVEIMSESLAQTRSIVGQNERVVETMQRQLSAMTQQADVMKRQLDAMAISERAYITVENIKINPMTVSNPRLTITADLFNGGRTPAFNVRSKTQVAILPKGKTPPLDWDACSEDEATGMLAASKSVHFDFTSVPNITQATVDALKSGDARLFIDAEIRYTDFGKIRQVLTVGYELEFSGSKSRAVVRYQEHRTEDNDPA